MGIFFKPRLNFSLIKSLETSAEYLFLLVIAFDFVCFHLLMVGCFP